MPNPTGYGRIVRDGYGNIQGIVEHNDCDEKQLEITEINPGYFCFQTPMLLDALDKITPNNVKNEYYLTDVFEYFWRHHWKVGAVKASHPDEIRGVNTVEQLEEARAVALDRAGTSSS